MKNTVKRMLSGLVAMSMVMGSAVSVSADTLEEAAADSGVTLTSKTELPFIDVTLPVLDEVALQLNPFNLGAAGQIYTGDLEVINNSEIPVIVTLKSAKVAKGASSGVSIVAKAPAATVTTKDVLVNLVYTDGTGKATTKALSETEQDITVATAMTPLGGKVSYTFTGSTAVAPAGGWTDDDTITVSNVFSFTPQVFTAYNITKTLALYAGDSATVEAKTGTKLPSSVLGDSKIEVPVIWMSGENKYDPDDPKAGTYVATISTVKTGGEKQTLSNADIYKIAETVKMPEITVTSAGS